MRLACFGGKIDEVGTTIILSHTKYNPFSNMDDRGT